MGFNQVRSESRLLTAINTLEPHSLGRGKFHFHDNLFSQLPSFLERGDLLVLNNTKVLPYRFFSKLCGGNWPNAGNEVEVLLVTKVPELQVAIRLDERNDEKPPAGGEEIWEALAQPMRKLAVGTDISLSPSLRATVLGRSIDKRRVYLVLRTLQAEISLPELIAREGTVPIPPYIREGRADAADTLLYQTVYAEHPGSIAAPTAGLHFTAELLVELTRRGIHLAYLTHHVGVASFQPIETDELSTYQMPPEFYSIPHETRQQIINTRAQGRNIIAVGTTTVRALESAAQSEEFFCPRKPIMRIEPQHKEQSQKKQDQKLSESRLFITPGFRFQVVDKLITNFHQPRSTHLLLVAAFVGRETLTKVYEHALSQNYRFLSYGDAMLLERKENLQQTFL